MAENPFADGCAYIDGAYFPIAEARIPIVDTGFTRSDVTYDVVAVWNGTFFRLKDHLNRFERGWNRLRMNPELSQNIIHFSDNVSSDPECEFYTARTHPNIMW